MNEIQDGQFCQAYAIASGGTPPYTFTWTGQFTDAHAQTGPLGENQIVNGFIDKNRGEDLWVEVKDAEDATEDDEVNLDIDSSYPYNPECEA